MTNLAYINRWSASLLITATPTITAAAYVTGNRLGSIMTLTNANRVQNGNCVLQSISIMDADSQSIPIDILFFQSSPTITSADRSAMSITTANMITAGYLGTISIINSYAALASNSSVTQTAINHLMGGTNVTATGPNLYAVAVARGSATYVSTTSLQFTFGFLQD